MAEPFVGEIRQFSFGIVPRGWHACDGTILNIQQHRALFALISNLYGGDGKTTFGLPDLRGRAQRGTGPSVELADSDGVEVIVLEDAHLPEHRHDVRVAGQAGTTSEPEGATPGQAKRGSVDVPIYAQSGNNVPLHEQTLGWSGGSRPFSNMQPFLVSNYCIAVQGMYPSRQF